MPRAFPRERHQLGAVSVVVAERADVPVHEMREPELLQLDPRDTAEVRRQHALVHARVAREVLEGLEGTRQQVAVVREVGAAALERAREGAGQQCGRLLGVLDAVLPEDLRDDVQLGASAEVDGAVELPAERRPERLPVHQLAEAAAGDQRAVDVPQHQQFGPGHRTTTPQP